jgi:hypothetical protein
LVNLPMHVQGASVSLLTERENMEIIKLTIESMHKHKEAAEQMEEKIADLERQISILKYNRNQSHKAEQRARVNAMNDIADLPREERSKWMEMLK